MNLRRFVLAFVIVFAFAILIVAQQNGQPQQPADHARAATPGAPHPEISPRAMKIHRSAIVLDTHIDTTQDLLDAGWNFFDRHQPPTPGQSAFQSGNKTNHVDYPRAKEGGLDGAFFSIWMDGRVTGPEAVKRALDQIDAVRSLVDAHPNELAFCTTAAEIRAAHKKGKFAVMMGVEGGHIIGNSLPVLRDYARLGARYLTLSHTVNTEWSDSSTDKPAHNGLTDFGKQVIKELNKLGMMVDVSHVSDKTFWDALEVSEAPLLASHSSAHAISGHPRNMTDEMIKALAAKGGVIQINYLDSYLSDELYKAQEAVRPQVEAKRAELEKQFPGPENADKRRAAFREFRGTLGPMPPVSWEKIIEHIDHVAKLVGSEHVGLGSDFDGASMPAGMEDVTHEPQITDALLKKGYTPAQIKGILGGNVLRLMEQVEAVSRRLRSAPTPPKGTK